MQFPDPMSGTKCSRWTRFRQETLYVDLPEGKQFLRS